MIAAVLAIILATLPWYPGGTSRWSTSPEYPATVKVIDISNATAAGRSRRDAAIREWNVCGAGVRLVVRDAEPFTPGTITIFTDNDHVGQDGPYGWYDEMAGYGFVGLGAGRSRGIYAHELGHALGFGHAPAGTRSVMDILAHVQNLDCRGLREYYGRR